MITTAASRRWRHASAPLKARLTALQGQLVTVLALAPFLNLDTSVINGLTGPHLIFEAVNVHIRSGSGTTDDGGALTGLGNLIIGYNEEPLGFAAGERAGSHNLSIGTGHRYLNFGGLVAGRRNTVSGGLNNTASGNNASVSGGSGNTASVSEASVSGGFSNTASGNDASVSGGSGNTASGLQASVSGGRSCKLTSTNAWGVGDSPITAGCPTTN